MSWETGRDNITTAALAGGELQRITGAQAAGAGWIADARTKLATAETISQSDPATAYVTAYDAARFALVAILAQQGPDFGAHDVEQVGGTILNRSSLGVASEAPSHLSLIHI